MVGPDARRDGEQLVLQANLDRGVAKVTSQLTHGMLAPALTAAMASERVSASTSWSLQTLNTILRPPTPPLALIWLASISAACSAGTSKGLIVFVSSITSLMTMGLLAPVVLGDPPELLGLDVEEPHDAITSAEMTATSSPAPQRRYDLVNFDFATTTPHPPETSSVSLP